MRKVMAAAVAVVTVMAAVLAAPVAAAAEPGPVTVSLWQAVQQLPVAPERREGYHRGLFRHWLDADRDGCSTRAEALLAEAVDAPAVGAGCALRGGRWYSPYDDLHVEGARGLDVDHTVPLAEAWDSGAFAWNAQRRADYANDLDEARSLLVVSARTNRSKADQDPSTWWPPFTEYRCGYLENWVAVKTRWGLSADAAEKDVLREQVVRCPHRQITVATVPPVVWGTPSSR